MKKSGLTFVVLLIFAVGLQPTQAGEIPKQLGISVVPITEHLRPFGAIVLQEEAEGEGLYAIKITVFNFNSRSCSVIDWFHTDLHPKDERFLEHLNFFWRKTFPETSSSLVVWVEFPEPATKLKMLMSLEAVPMK